MVITNHKQFLIWLGLKGNEDYSIYTSAGVCNSSIIEFSDWNKDIKKAVEKFDNHIHNVLKRIEADIDYRFTDEAIIEDIEANDYEFLSNGKKY